MTRIPVGNNKFLQIEQVETPLNSAHYTITERSDLKLFEIDLFEIEDTEDAFNVFATGEPVGFWADSEENAFNFLKENVKIYKDCFLNIPRPVLGFDEKLDNLAQYENNEKYLDFYLKGSYIDIDYDNDSQLEVIRKCVEANRHYLYCLRKTGELVDKLKDNGIFEHLT